MKIQAYAAREPRGILQAFEYDAEPKENEVLVRVTHCGICHSDVHLVDGDWGEFFPLVPGHEVIGTVEKGTGFARGTRVGIGWQCASCGQCEWCKAGKEVVCAEHLGTCMGHHGGFAGHVIAQNRFVFPIPAELESTSAAPLLCGGATVYTPLKLYGRPGARVAVIGIGGLGHPAIQYPSPEHIPASCVTSFPLRRRATPHTTGAPCRPALFSEGGSAGVMKRREAQIRNG